MYHVLMTLTFIQGHTDLNHEKDKCLINSETVQAMPIKYAVKIVRPKAYNMPIARPMNLTVIQGHKCVSNVTTFELAVAYTNYWTIFKQLHSNVA